MYQNPTQRPDSKNLMIAVVAMTAIMFGWQYFYERPRLIAQQAQQAKILAEKKAAEKTAAAPVLEKTQQTITPEDTSARVRISTPSLHGSFSLTGARLDDVTLVNYRESLEPGAKEVPLLMRAGSADAYFAEIGVLADSAQVRVPDATTKWSTSSKELTPSSPVTLTWNNGAGLIFERKIALDDQFMFTVTTTVKNSGAAPVTLYPYGLVSRNYTDAGKHNSFIHEGPLVVANQVLEDMSYKDVREQKTGPKEFAAMRGWLGIADKYWLTALIPAQDAVFDTSVKHFKRADAEAYQADMRGEAMEVPAGGSSSFTMHVFSGAKKVSQLDAYSKQYNIPLFDRTVDFGTLYFLAKPLFLLLMQLYSWVGNYGIAILLLTVCVKLVLFPLANKSMVSMSRMKLLQPQMEEIKKQYGADKMRMNQEMMGLYKREKVNPAGGCLPLLLQIPVFFALYRVQLVAIEMRHAPFFGWVQDLSAKDSSNLFTAFGYLPWDAPSLLHLGVWPILYCVSMILMQRMNPKPTDPVQAAMMNYMPFLMTFVFMSFPVGLVIYYSWNNVLTMLQQYIINKKLEKKGLK